MSRSTSEALGGALLAPDRAFRRVHSQPASRRHDLEHAPLAGSPAWRAPTRRGRGVFVRHPMRSASSY